GSPGRPAGRAVAAVFRAPAVFSLAALPLLSRPSGPPPAGIGTRPTTSTGPVRSETGRADHSFNLGWLVIPMALTFAVLAPAAFLIRRRLSRALADPDELGPAVRASITAL